MQKILKESNLLKYDKKNLIKFCNNFSSRINYLRQKILRQHI